MTKKDYIVLAGFMRDMKPLGGGYAQRRWQEHLDWLAWRLKQDNPRFDVETFRDACERGDNYHKSDNVRKTEGEV